MKEAIITTILKKIKEGSIPKEPGINLCYQVKNLAESTSTQSSSSKDIAIIGLAGRYPQAGNINEFWENLKKGKDSISEIPPDRWKWQDYFHPHRQEAPNLGKTYSKWGGFIDDIDKFDPLFFNISPREAEVMDPQERLFLEVAWEALEDAGYSITSLKANKTNQPNIKIGVFVGATWDEYQFFSGIGNNSEGIVFSTNTSSISNRVSYYCDLKGSSLTVNTACSSSLTALHLACASLIQGTDTMALAGGVNLSLHPNKYLSLSNSQFVSGKGRCESFGRGGDGYVPGEGVGCVLLKPLEKAIAHHDHIYGIIKGTAINHGGKTNGYTIPNPNAQANVIGQAFKEAGISPQTINYIEAHGTGTSLGDPIEIAGLTKAFREYTQDKQFCAIGSVKSNIGHGESAAGIAGVTKVLLQLKHRQLVPSLHSKTLNPNIDFSNTPFVVQQELAEWKPPQVKINGETREYPRRAGISSFGAGGANAHVVIEEWSGAQSVERKEQNPAVIVLSAKDEERLREQVQRLLAALRGQPYPDASLADIAYTLQVGREPMEERLAVMADSVKELEEKLGRFLEGQEVEDLYRGQVKRNKEALAVFTADEELQEAIEKWIQRKKFAKLLDLWVKGLIFDWDKLYEDNKPNRLSLPTYPFSRERYWIPGGSGQKTEDRGQKTGSSIRIIHPLLQENTSDLSEQRFSSTFTGQEFFLSDHVVMGQRVLPGVAYLEMARAAVEQAVGTVKQGQVTIRLKNVVWALPISVRDQPVRVHIGLFPQDSGSGEIAFEIYSQLDAGEPEPVVHCQGSAVLSSITAIPPLDLPALQTRCNQSTLSPDQCYEAFRTMGIDYGPGHQGIEQVNLGPGQVLAKLSLPASVSDTGDQFVLHPSLMDSALQASLGLMMEPGDPKPGSTASLKLALPFALEELQVIGACTSAGWALIRPSKGSKPGDKVQKMDVDLCDEQGKICVCIKGFSMRMLEGEKKGTLLLYPEWKEQTVDREAEIAVPEYAQHLVILCEPGKDTVSREIIETQLKGTRCLTLKSPQEDIEERFQTYTARVFQEIQTILKEKPRKPVLIQVVVFNRDEQRLFSGLSGLLKTAQLENPKIIGQLLEVEPGEDWQGIPGKLEENSRYPMDNRFQYQAGKRRVATWSDNIGPINPIGPTAFPWKDRGNYLITGGAGGLGLIFAREIARQVKDATLILTGRSPLHQEKQTQLQELEASGARVRYRQVDVTQKQAVADLIQSIIDDFDSLDGIIHCAGVIRDNFILKKTKDELEEVLAPKVRGLVYLDQASKNLPLDFFILFSSLTGAVGNIGQADYAAANAFMDAYATYRNALAAEKKRQGKTLSINWSLWKEGGMRIDKETEKLMSQTLGITAMQTETGIQAFYQAFASGMDQVVVAAGDLERLPAVFLEIPSETTTPKEPTAEGKNNAVPEMAPDLLREKASHYFRKLLSSVIKLPAHKIEADTPMDKYGIDSIMVMQMTNQLEKTFGSLSKTLFFEYQNLRELTGYFLESHRDQLIQLLGIEEKAAVSTSILDEKGPAEVTEPRKSPTDSRGRPRFASVAIEPREAVHGALDIAIIGLSGRYPRARSTREFWENLRDGKDCITEIPKDRWDHSLYFDEDKNKPGKTYTKWGGFLEGVDEFDPLFFNISPLEAEYMDPQERLFLECVFETLEDAGYTKETINENYKLQNTNYKQIINEEKQDSPVNGASSEKFLRGPGAVFSKRAPGSVGVYVGVMYEEYQLYGAQETVLGRPLALPGNPSSIANRVSYFCNFHGPSMAVDTMCSSSLTAIHLACQSLRQGECQVAFAGGVNVSIHPNKYLTLGQGKFASSTGRCESFGQGGDGYVPGEGVGAVLLKPLSRAVADGDHIYGIIKSTAINHGGKTNGYTVPNPNAQSSVIERAFRQAGLDPRTISYIEAHGTGTSLGDPIEITGLTKAFREYTKDKGFCAIGSAKSNIGHCESAAGIAGVTKVLLQLRHCQLVPSLHSQVLNPHIDFSNSPFVVQRKLEEWKRPVLEIDGGTSEYPRRAGVSSFGAGGSNAHVVIEEYIPPDPESTQIAVTNGRPAIIVLSAKNEERLRERVEQLSAAITNPEQQFTDAHLANIAYTLQVGREAMEERLALISSSIRELREKLQGFLEGQDGIEDLYRGQVKSDEGMMAAFAADEDMAKTIAAWLSKGKYGKFLEIWVKGLIFDWQQWYSSVKPRRLSLPPYPFARERYWVPGLDVKSGPTPVKPLIATPAVYLHPLLQQNTSDLWEQRFSSIFTGQEFFLADHMVKGQRVLPGVVYIEMARAAVNQTLGNPDRGEKGIQLKNVVWTRPVVVRDQPVQIHIALFPLDDDKGEITFEIYSDPEADGTEPVVHSQGRAVLEADTRMAEAPTLDLPALQARISQTGLTASQCYEAFKAAGIHHGPGFQGIEALYVGADHVLAKISLPASVSGTQEQFVLHPSLMDSALQVSAGLVGLLPNQGDPMPPGSTAPTKPALPFALEELEIFGPCPPRLWAVVRTGKNSKPGDKVRKLDIDMCDETGTICVRLKGFSTRVLEGEREPPGESLVGTIMLTPVWETIKAEKGQTFPAPTDQVLVVGGTKDNRSAVREHYPKARVLEMEPGASRAEITKKLESIGLIDHILWIAPHHPLETITEDLLVEGQKQGVLQVFRMIKALLDLDYGTRDLGWSVITIQSQYIRANDPVNPTHASVHGLMGSLAKEYPHWKIRLIDLEAGGDWPLAQMFTLPADPRGDAWAYRDKQWHRQQLVPLRCPPPDRELYRSGGVYVVIGGAGGIGEVWSEYMIRTYQAQVTWIGRRENDAVIQTKLDRLAALGPAPRYIAADAANKDALQQAYEEIKQQYSQIHGVIHSAIVLSDQSLVDMDEERFRAVLTAKVDVSVRMAQVFHNEPLDFVLFFSSIITFTKNPGQSNYAAGCTFKDAFARQLSQEWPCAVKVMNWGYWGSVGIVASKDYRDRMARLGIGSIEPPEAMEALETLLAGPIHQIALMKTTKPLAMMGIDPDELITFYPGNLPTNILDAREHMSNSKQDSPVKPMKPGNEPQIKEMEELVCKLLWGQLQSIGLFTEKNQVTTDLKTKTGGRDFYELWLGESTAVLARHNYLQYDGKSYVVKDTTPIAMDALWKEWDLKKGPWLADPQRKAQVVLVEATLRALPDILTGKRLATDVLFPNSSMELVEGVYKHNPVAAYFNEVLAEIAAVYIQERLKQDSSAAIRILEIGAGTGGSSAAVFEKIRPYRDHLQEYCYSDISKAFLMHAEKEYGPGNPYLTYQIFNVEAPLAGQGISAGGYDIVIAANVLHTTKNIRQTLRNTKAALRKNGLLLLNELSANSLFTHLTFGLLEGWWRYEDPELRIPGCPGLATPNWQRVLESEGFSSVFFPAKENHGLGQQVITAVSDGVVRQKQQTKPAITAPVKEIKTNRLQKNREGEITRDLLREKSTAYFKKITAETLKIPLQKINSSESLAKYGIDSILVVQLTNALGEVFDNISSTLFFEYQTIDALVDYFINTQKDSLIALVGLEDQELDEKISGNEKTVVPPSPAHSPQGFRKPGRFSQSRYRQTREPGEPSSRLRDIAVIGLSGRYPQADDINQFWNNLKEGKNCITEIPGDRWDWKEYFDREKGKLGKIYTKWGGFIRDIDKFDPLFFQISPREAENMDPQERLFLQTAYASIEDAGYTPVNLCDSRKIGVFIGVMNANYPTGASYWSIANRLSYLLNFQGPSMAVDTACSSSLTAIHLALESLYNGMCECAIAGGVNLIVDPIHYLKLTAMTMLSSGEQNKSFGDQADGFVDGEGVGAIILKPLSKAIADGDHIYGIIKGSMLNAGGKTSGYTVPNPAAQSRLITEALQRAKVHARTISYLEAHGTGTALGDPIEIAGLTRTFEQDTQDKQFCAIGSLKSNIGHCESAAGIAGVTKVLLQMQRGQLVPSLHAKVLNPQIDFNSTPFVVQQELTEWKRPVLEIDGVTREYPRRAGVSSFGAGGANAHLVMEEYIPRQPEPPPPTITSRDPAIIVLSARNAERLREQVQHLVAAVTNPGSSISNTHLADMAYTLQVGREAMEERLAVIVGSIEELWEKLEGFLENREGIENLYRGQVKRNKETLAAFTVDEDLRQAIDGWVSKKKYGKLLDFWVKGLMFDWNKFYDGDKPGKPRRVSLPTYPFARERYWQTGPAARVDSAAASTAAGSASYLHPLVQQNTSHLSEIRFSSTFSGQEPFLLHYPLNSRSILPGMAYLEMARAAVDLAAGDLKKSPTGIRLKNVVWAQPIAIGNQAVRIHIGLFPGDNGTGEIDYEIYSQSENVNSEPVVHSQGTALPGPIPSTPILDLQAWQAQCSQGSGSSDQWHKAFKAMGIEAVYPGPRHVLAKLSLPATLPDNGNQFVLLPGLMDAALQVSLGLKRGFDDFKPVLPFALQELEIFANCTPGMWALIRCPDGSDAEDKEQKFDIDLCDEAGAICVRMKGLTSRVPGNETGTLMLRPSWQEQTIVPGSETPAPGYAQHLAILCEPEESWKPGSKKAGEQGKGHPAHHMNMIHVQSRQGDIGERFRAYAARVFEEIRGILKNKPGGKVLVQVVVPGGNEGDEKSLMTGLGGLLKTAHLENPDFLGQLIEVEPAEDWEGLLEKLVESSRYPDDTHIRYQEGKRWAAGWTDNISLISPIRPTAPPWRDRGVYLITGGAGGLGLIFAREILQEVKDAALVLTGRSPLNRLSQEKQAQLKEFAARANGARIEYKPVDITQKPAVHRLFRAIHKDFGNLHGIIHSAGVIRDNFILRKTGEELQEVLAPKVSGLVNLDRASKDMNLDFFILFSSTAGALGNIGQADYSTANAFMDAYARYRNALVALKQRRGQTLSINWPLWNEGGMHIDAETAAFIRQKTGIIPLPTTTGIQVFYQALAPGIDRVMVLHGGLKKLKNFLGLGAIEPEQFDDQFYRDLSEKISNGQLSEDQLEKMIMG